MNWQIIRTLIGKELTIYFRDKFLAVITVLALVFYVGIYYALPSNVDVDIELGVYADDGISDELVARFAANAITVVEAESEEALVTAVEDSDYSGGVVLAAGAENQVKLYLSANSPEELNNAVEMLINMVFNDRQFNLQFEVLGHDFGGESLSMQKRILPLFAVIILLMEIIGLSTMIAVERSTKMLQALLVTPMSVTEFFLGKVIMGVGLAFGQAFILMLVVGGLSTEPLPLLVILFIGAMLVTGISFLIGSVGRDMMSNIGWTMLALFTMMIPAITILIPGTYADWIQIIPSYYIVDTVHRVVNMGAVWADVWQNIAITFAFAVAFLVLGVEVLKRRLT